MLNVTLATLKTRCRERADMVDSEFIDDTELLTYINASYTELYDILVSKFEDYYVAEPTQFTISSGSNTYTLPSDFYKLRGVDYLISNSDWVALKKFNFNERNMASSLRARYRRVPNMSYRIVGNKLYIEPSDIAPGTYRIWYTPATTMLSSDSDTVDGVNGWEEYIVVDVAIKMLAKEESSTTHLERERARLLERIETMAANRDYDQPESVSDVSSIGYWDGFERF